MKMWAVEISYYYGEEAPQHRLETDIKLCRTREAAVVELERVIREDWTAEVRVGPDYKFKPLADMRGQSEMEDDIKWSDWCYTEDGETAWLFYGDTGYKGKVVEIEIDGVEAAA
jgi:hypothetical protein